MSQVLIPKTKLKFQYTYLNDKTFHFPFTQEKYPWMYNLSVVTYRLIKDTLYNRWIKFNGLTLGDSMWTLQGFSVRIINAVVPRTKFFLISSDNTNMTYSATISNSSFGQINASKGFHIDIVNCYIDGSIRLTSTLIEIINGTLNIENFIFYNQIKYDKGPAMMNAVSSHINLVNGSVVQNYAKDSLIWVSNNSHLSVHNSVFESNGIFVLTSSIFILKYNAVLLLSNCICANNGAIIGACVLASGYVSIVSKDSIFKKNHAASGGVLYWKNTVDDSEKENHTAVSEFNTRKSEVNVKNVKKTNWVHGYKSKLVFEKCTITGHISFEGSVLSADGSLVDVIFNGCKLELNGGFKDVGSIFVKGRHWSLTTLSIHGCFFESEFSYASGILFIKRAQVNIYKSTIIMCRFAIISVTDFSIVNITRLSVMQSPGIFGYVDIRNSVTFEMTDSQMTSMFMTVWVNGFFLYATNNCSARVTNSLFGDEN